LFALEIVVCLVPLLLPARVQFREYQHDHVPFSKQGSGHLLPVRLSLLCNDYQVFPFKVLYYNESTAAVCRVETTMNSILHVQPFKALYLAFEVLSIAFFRVPYWLVLAIPQ